MRDIPYKVNLPCEFVVLGQTRGNYYSAFASNQTKTSTNCYDSELCSFSSLTSISDCSCLLVCWRRSSTSSSENSSITELVVLLLLREPVLAAVGEDTGTAARGNEWALTSSALGDLRTGDTRREKCSNWKSSDVIANRTTPYTSLQLVKMARFIFTSHFCATAIIITYDRPLAIIINNY